MSAWKKVKIGDLCKIVKGATGIASAEQGEYPLVVTAEERKTCSTYQFDCEAVCIPLVSSSGHGKKSLKNVHYQSGKFALGTILCAVIPNNPDELDARYLHQYLQFYKDTLLVPLMKGAANVSLSMKDIATVEFPLPPIEKQRELATLFVNATEKQKLLTAESQKQTEYAKLLRQNILQEAIEGKLTADWRKQNPVQKDNPDYDAEALFEKIQENRHSELVSESHKKQKPLAPIIDEEKPFAIPDSWKWVRLGEIGESNIGVTYHPEDVCENGFPVYRSNNIVNAKISNDDLVRINFEPREAQRLKPNDILLCARNGSQKLVGKCAIINELNEESSFGAFMTIYRSLFYKFIFLLLQSDFFRKYMDNSSSTNIYQLTQSMLVNCVCPLPPLKEQEEIVNKVETLLAKVTTLENQIQERKTLSEKLIFGIIKENLEGEK